MFYHVLIKVKKHPGLDHSIEIYKLDTKSMEDLENQIIAPYLKGEPFELEGRTVTKEIISRLKVFKSQYDTTYYAKIQDERNRVRGFLMGTKRVEILHYPEYVTDITKESVKRALVEIPEPTSRPSRR
jgi:hypothetical protein